jgi:hypothetical protein
MLYSDWSHMLLSEAKETYFKFTLSKDSLLGQIQVPQLPLTLKLIKLLGQTIVCLF